MNKESPSRTIVITTALFAALCGLYLLAWGIWLASLGGSLYYIITGVLMLAVAWLLVRRSGAALWLYALVLIGSMIWAVWEVGFDFWALTPRCDVLVFLGIWLLLPFVYRGIIRRLPQARAALAVSLLLSGVVLLVKIAQDPQDISGNLNTAIADASADASSIPAGDWPAYGRTQVGEQLLQQINDKNVGQLKEAWRFRTGDMKGPNDPTEITDEVTPIKIRDTLYLCSPHQILFALDAATGKEKWRFDPQLKPDPTFQHVTCRGGGNG